MKKTYNLSGDWTETVIYVNKNFVRKKNESGTFDSTYVYYEGQLIAERKADTSRVYYHPDHLGSTTLITDNSGNLVENTFYSPYGVILNGGEESRYDYEGKEYDDTIEQYDFHFRGYKAEWGKFTQADTVIKNVYDPQSLNRYSFEKNNPYKYTDESGHVIEPVTAFLVLAAVITIASLAITAVDVIYYPEHSNARMVDYGITSSLVIAGYYTGPVGAIGLALAGLVWTGLRAGYDIYKTRKEERKNEIKNEKTLEDKTSEETNTYQTFTVTEATNPNNDAYLNPITSYVSPLAGLGLSIMEYLIERGRNELRPFNGGTAGGGGPGCSGSGCQGQGGSVNPNTGENTDANGNPQ